MEYIVQKTKNQKGKQGWRLPVSGKDNEIKDTNESVQRMEETWKIGGRSGHLHRSSHPI